MENIILTLQIVIILILITKSIIKTIKVNNNKYMEVYDLYSYFIDIHEQKNDDFKIIQSDILQVKEQIINHLSITKQVKDQLMSAYKENFLFYDNQSVKMEHNFKAMYNKQVISNEQTWNSFNKKLDYLDNKILRIEQNTNELIKEQLASNNALYNKISKDLSLMLNSIKSNVPGNTGNKSDPFKKIEKAIDEFVYDGNKILLNNELNDKLSGVCEYCKEPFKKTHRLQKYCPSKYGKLNFCKHEKKYFNLKNQKNK